MGVRINTNIDAINAQRNLGMSASSFSKSVERLSSGLRINRAADDAAGMSISEKLRGQVRGLNQASRNAQDGISLLQTAEGAMNETHTMLQRMRELAVQGANETLTGSDRSAIAQEMVTLRDEVNRIANTTQFNGKNLLQGSLNTAVDTGTSEVVQGDILATAKVAVSKLNVDNAAGSTNYQFSSGAAGKLTLTNNATGVAQTVDVAAMTTQGTSTQELNFSELGVTVTLSGYDAAGTAANIITDLTAGANDTIATAAGGSLSLQVGANSNQTISVSVSDSRSTAIGNAGGYTNLSAAVDDFNAAPSTAKAQNLLQSLDASIADVSSNRSKLGAYQNRLEHTIANVGVASENLAASESRIRDLDMAAEMVSFTRSQILQQAGTAILAQANQSSQGVLSLLR